MNELLFIVGVNEGKGCDLVDGEYKGCMTGVWEMYFKYIGMYENELKFKGFYDGPEI